MCRRERQRDRETEREEVGEQNGKCFLESGTTINFILARPCISSVCVDIKESSVAGFWMRNPFQMGSCLFDVLKRMHMYKI